MGLSSFKFSWLAPNYTLESSIVGNGCSKLLAPNYTLESSIVGNGCSKLPNDVDFGSNRKRVHATSFLPRDARSASAVLLS